MLRLLVLCCYLMKARLVLLLVMFVCFINCVTLSYFDLSLRLAKQVMLLAVCYVFFVCCCLLVVLFVLMLCWLLFVMLVCLLRLANDFAIVQSFRYACCCSCLLL